MHYRIKSAVLTLAAAIIVAASCAVTAADPVLGNWQLNVAKSKITPAGVYKSQTRAYSQSGSSISVVIKTVTADGKQNTTQSTYQTDGKDYPATGSPDYDTISARQVNVSTAQFVLKRSGKQVGSTDRTVSKDGKTLTANTKITTASGQTIEGTLVFDKQ